MYKISDWRGRIGFSKRPEVIFLVAHRSGCWLQDQCPAGLTGARKCPTASNLIPKELIHDSSPA